MKVLLAGIDRAPHLGVSFRVALETMGHDVRMVDPSLAFTVLDRRPYRWFTRPFLGGVTSGFNRFQDAIRRTIRTFRPDIVLAVGGMPWDDLLQEIRTLTKAQLVMYSTDNPFNPVASPEYVRKSLPYWDAIATPRRANISELSKCCKGKVFYLPFGYDPALHFPESPSSEAERAKFRSDVAFLGGCDRDRVAYLDPLARSDGWNVAYYGGYYGYTAALRKRHKGMAYGRDYRLALSGTRIALCLVRRANADGHVMRTFEAPACRALMMAERTPDHEEMFEENREAVFFTSPEEMLDKTKFYLENEDLRSPIAHAGYERVTSGSNTYTDRIRSLLELATN